VSSSPRIKAVLFDCDGVLVDSEVIAMEIERAHLDAIGLRYGIQEYAERFIGLSDNATRLAVQSDYERRLGKPFPPDFFTVMKAAYRARLATHLLAVPGAAQTLCDWAGPKAIASSSALAQLETKLRLTHLWDLIAPHVYSAEQVAAGKPAPDIFLFAAQQIGQVPQACLVIEDSLNGVLAGVAAGMRVWAFTGGGHADAGLAARLMELGAEQSFASHAALSTALQGLV
jgi:HAD superfamily hydrolase (TIGR01509 family)